MVKQKRYKPKKLDKKEKMSNDINDNYNLLKFKTKYRKLKMKNIKIKYIIQLIN